MFLNFKKTLKKVNIGFAFLLAASATFAQTADNYTALVGTGSFVNFKTNYSPEALNTNAASSVFTLRTRHSGLSQSRIKVFIPPGTKIFRTSIVTYKVNQPAIAAVRFSLPPISLASDVVPNVNGSDSRQTLEKLQQGQELKFYSPELSGLLVISTAEAGTAYQSSTGGYVYINFFNIPGGSFMTFDAQVEVEKTCYQSWYNSVNQSNTWNSAGNPRDDATHTCAGSSGGEVVVPTPTLTGIALSTNTWKSGASPDITVTAQPTSVTLPACTSSNTALLSLSQASDGQLAKFTVHSDAVTDTANVTVTCGDKTAQLSLQPPGVVATVSSENTQLLNVDGKAVLKITLNHTDAEVIANAKLDYWVAALIPRDLPFFEQDEWFFLTPAVDGGYQWVQLQNSFDVGSVVFKKNEMLNRVGQTGSLNKTKELTMPLGFAASEFKRIAAKIYLVYSQNVGPFREVGVVWDASQYLVNTTLPTTEVK